MIRNDVFVQRGIRAVELRQPSVSAFLRINTVVIWLGDVIKGNPWVVQAELEGCKVCGSLRYSKFTNFSQNICLWRVNML